MKRSHEKFAGQFRIDELLAMVVEQAARMFVPHARVRDRMTMPAVTVDADTTSAVEFSALRGISPHLLHRKISRIQFSPLAAALLASRFLTEPPTPAYMLADRA